METLFCITLVSKNAYNDCSHEYNGTWLLGVYNSLDLATERVKSLYQEDLKSYKSPCEGWISELDKTYEDEDTIEYSYYTKRDAELSDDAPYNNMYISLTIAKVELNKPYDLSV